MKLSLLLPLALSLTSNLSLLAQDPLPSPSARTIRAQDLIRVTPRRTPNPQPPPSEILLSVEKFFQGLKKGDILDAYTQLLSETRIGQQKENVDLLVEKTHQAFGLYGKLIDYEIYDNYPIGSHLLVLTYLTTLPVQPLRWKFVFYRPEATWQIIDIRVDDVLADLIE